MTRVTFGMYRKAVREPTTTLSSAAAVSAGFTLVTPMRTGADRAFLPGVDHRNSPSR